MDWKNLIGRNNAYPSSSGIVFENITVPSVPNTGRVSRIPDRRPPFDVRCVRYFTFAATEPVFDLTLVNRSRQRVMLTSVGLKIVSVAHTWLIAGKPEVYPIDISGVVIIRMPDLWRHFENTGLLAKDIHTLADVGGDMPPQNVNKVLSGPVPSPMYLEPDAPYRYIMALADYLENMPNYAILEFTAEASGSPVSSNPVCVFTLGHLLHAVSKKEHDDSQRVADLRAKANRAFEIRDFPSAEASIRKALSILKGNKSENRSDILHLTHNLGIICYQQGKSKDAEKLLLESIDEMQRQFGRHSREYRNCLTDLVAVYESLGDYTKAQDVIRRLQ